jgi:hypothetical protein
MGPLHYTELPPPFALYDRWRAFRATNRVLAPAGFVDGSFVETFSDLDAQTVADILAGANEHERIERQPADVAATLDALSRLH